MKTINNKDYPESKQECRDMNCGACGYYGETVKECGYDGEDFGFDYEKGEFR